MYTEIALTWSDSAHDYPAQVQLQDHMKQYFAYEQPEQQS